MQESLLKKIFASFKQLFLGQVIYTIASFISVYFFARLLGPEKYGTWQTAVIFTQYSILFSLGLPFIMRRDFIQLRSEGQLKEAENMANQVFSYLLFAGPLFSIVLIVYAVFFSNDIYFKSALITVALINLFNVISSYGDIMTKGFNHYNILKNAKIILSVFTLLTILFVYFYDFKGLLFGITLSSFAYAIFFYVKRPLKYKWFWENKLLKSMIFVGFPLYLQNIVQTIFSSIDRLIIAGFLSFKEVGYYSLSAMIKMPITLLVISLGIVVFTQLNEKFGKDTSSKVIRLHMEVPQLFISYILPPIIIMGIIALPLVTHWALPKYIPGIQAAQIYAFAVLFLTLAGFSSNALFVLNKQIYAAISFFIAGVIKTIGSILLLKLNYGIEGVATVTLFSYFIYDILMVLFVNREINSKNTFTLYIKKYIPVIYVVTGYFLSIGITKYLFHAKNGLFELGLQEGIYILLMIPYYFIARKKVTFILAILK